MTRPAEILDGLGHAIVRGDYPPGGTLPIEQDLAVQFAAGRNAVREAIKVLAGRGFVRTERRSGTIVLPATEWNLLDPQVLTWLLLNPQHRDRALSELTGLRGLLEPEIAALAATQATTTEILRLFEACEAMEASAAYREAAIEADILFHRRLAEAAHNRLMLSVMKCFEVLLRTNFEMVMAVDGRFIRNLVEHRVVAEYVMARDAPGARRAMLKLLENNAEDIAELIPSQESATADAI
jgi:GntR family galactonate operon transcriptional repressor